MAKDDSADSGKSEPRDRRQGERRDAADRRLVQRMAADGKTIDRRKDDRRK